jgi:Winged helix DNA-binding domain
MTEKLLHVSCIVRDSHVYDLLRALEASKVGNVEVRPVTPMLALPAPDGKGKRGGRVPHGAVLTVVRAAMQLKEPVRARQLARALNIKSQSVVSAIARLTNLGLVKRTGHGLYTRVKPDPIPTNSNGAAVS